MTPTLPGTRPARITRTQRLAETGVAVSLAVVLSAVVVWRAPQGGAVTLGAMVPLWVLSRRWGVRTGAGAGGLYGLVQLLLGATVVHPVQALLDYGLAFVAQGLAGWRRLSWVLAAVLAGTGRLAAHVGAAAFFLPGRPAAEVVPFALAYNGSFLVPDWILALLVWRALLQARPALDEPPGIAPKLDANRHNADDLI